MPSASLCSLCGHRLSLASTSTWRRLLSSQAAITVDGQSFPRDAQTNAPPSILTKIPFKLHERPNHPISILRKLIHSHFPPSFQAIAPTTPAVSVEQNFDDLGFAADHPGRASSDSYYLNSTHMLRTHTSAHEVETFRQGHDRWLLTADVYRRDEIDRSHYPVFHQMEGAYVLPSDQIASVMQAENEEMEAAQKEAARKGCIVIDDPTVAGVPSNPWQTKHNVELARIVDKSLKLHLNRLVLGLFGAAQKLRGQTEPLQVRWIEAFFPFTTPSYEVEVLFDGKWLEILGCGVAQQATLERAGVPNKMGWAFGLGLERIAMVLFSIPDIRLFWSEDARFTSQFSEGALSTFVPYSRYPSCYKDLSFWVQPGFHENDFCDLVRTVAGDLVSDVACIDSFHHPKTQRQSLCYRITYQSMDRNLSNEEINDLQAKVTSLAIEDMKIEVR